MSAGREGLEDGQGEGPQPAHNPNPRVLVPQPWPKPRSLCDLGLSPIPCSASPPPSLPSPPTPPAPPICSADPHRGVHPHPGLPGPAVSGVGGRGWRGMARWTAHGRLPHRGESWPPAPAASPSPGLRRTGHRHPSLPWVPGDKSQGPLGSTPGTWLPRSRLSFATRLPILCFLRGFNPKAFLKYLKMGGMGWVPSLPQPQGQESYRNWEVGPCKDRVVRKVRGREERPTGPPPEDSEAGSTPALTS